MKTCLLLTTMLCCAAVSAAGINYGFVHTDSDGRGYLYLAERLNESDTIWLQWPDSQGGVSCCRKLHGTQLQEAPNPPIYAVTADSGNIVNYLIQELPRPVPDTAFIGIALSGENVSAKGAYQLQSSQSTLRASGKLCFGAEGINLITRINDRHDRIYLSLGYDIESSPACTDDDFGPVLATP